MNREVEGAAKVTCGSCDFCPSVHINLIDGDGELFATAALPVASLDAFIKQLRDCAGEIMTRSRAPARRQ